MFILWIIIIQSKSSLLERLKFVFLSSSSDSDSDSGLSTPDRVGCLHDVLIYMEDQTHTQTCIFFLPEFVYPGCLYADNGAIIFIDDGITEHGGLVHVYHLAVHLIFCADKWKRGDHSKPSYTLSMSKVDEDASDIEKLCISCNIKFSK